MLSDCGSKESASTGVLKRAVRHLVQNELPDAAEAGKKRLDMIVVTHRHEDHIKGFDAADFRDVAVKHIWLTAAMDESHEQARRTQALHSLATNAMRALAETGESLSPQLNRLLALYGVNNDNATKTLTETLPRQNDIVPTYVFAGQTSDDHGITIADTTILVLAPERDIDRFYLGRDADASLRGLEDGAEHFRRF